MAWLIAGLPLVVIVASVVTIGVARRSPAAASDGETRRIAQIQIADLAPDRAAARRGLHAELEGERTQGRIAVRLSDADIDQDLLELSMLHPVDERQDRHLSLRRDGEAWRAMTTPWAAHAWELRLKPADGDWRLTGRLAAERTRATLSPAVAK